MEMLLLDKKQEIQVKCLERNAGEMYYRFPTSQFGSAAEFEGLIKDMHHKGKKIAVDLWSSSNQAKSWHSSKTIIVNQK